MICCDNSSTVSLATNPVLHARVKHIELDLHFARDKVLNGQLQVNYVPGTNQVVDVLTKPLTMGVFLSCRNRMNVLAANIFQSESAGGILAVTK